MKWYWYQVHFVDGRPYTNVWGVAGRRQAKAHHYRYGRGGKISKIVLKKKY